MRYYFYGAADDDIRALKYICILIIRTDRSRGTRELSGALSVLSEASLAYVYHARRPHESCGTQPPRNSRLDCCYTTAAAATATAATAAVVVFSGSHAPASSLHSSRRRQLCTSARRRCQVARAFSLRSTLGCAHCDNSTINLIVEIFFVTVPEPESRQDVGKWPSCIFSFLFIYFIYLFVYVYFIRYARRTHHHRLLSTMV